MGDLLDWRAPGNTGCCRLFASHSAFSFCRLRRLQRGPSPPPPGTRYRCRPHLLRPLPPQQASDGALPTCLTGQAARRRPWKAAAHQTLRGRPDATQTWPRTRAPSVRPASPASCTWPQPLEPSPGAATCLPGCLSTAPSGKSTRSAVSPRPWAGAGSRARAASPGLPATWGGVLSSDGGDGARVALLCLRGRANSMVAPSGFGPAAVGQEGRAGLPLGYAYHSVGGQVGCPRDRRPRALKSPGLRPCERPVGSAAGHEAPKSLLCPTRPGLGGRQLLHHPPVPETSVPLPRRAVGPCRGGWAAGAG